MSDLLTMDFRQLSANIDQKLSQLDAQIKQLNSQLIYNEANQQTQQELAALQELRLKIIKSRNIAERAHKLQRNTDKQQIRRHRILGLGLCVFSGLGLLALALYVIFR